MIPHKFDLNDPGDFNKMIIGTVKQIWRHPVKSMAGELLDSCTVDTLGISGDRGWALRDEVAKETTGGKKIPRLLLSAARYRDEPMDGNIPHVEIVLPSGASINSDSPDINERLSEEFGKTLTLWPRQPASNKEHFRRSQRGARLAGILARYGAFRTVLRMMTKFGSMNRDLRVAFSREADEPIPDISVLPPEVLEFTSPLGTYFDAFPIHVMTTSSLDAMAQFNKTARWDVRRFRANFLIETDSEGLLEAGWSGKSLRLGTVELECQIPAMRCGMTMQAQNGLPKDSSVLRSIVKDANQNLGVYAKVLRAGSVKVGDSVELL